MADIASALAKMNDIEVAGDAPITEALLTKIGANINGLIDDSSSQAVRLTALEGATYGASVVATVDQSFSTSATVLSKSFTLTASDYVVFQFGSLKSDLTNQPFQTTSGTGGSTITAKRDSTTLGTKSAGAGVTNQVSGQLIDKPGAGTFTYSIVVSSAGSSTYWLGGAAIQKVEG